MYCRRTWIRPEHIHRHQCARETRVQQRSHPTTLLALTAWQWFNKKPVSTRGDVWFQFESSTLYDTFWNFAAYCRGNHCGNPRRYLDWCLQNKIPDRSWCRDANYDRFLREFIRTEAPLDSVIRSVQTLRDLADSRGLALSEVWSLSANLICQKIQRGDITPWLLYCCDTGQRWLASLNSNQLTQIFTWINPDFWHRRVTTNSHVPELQRLLTQAGL